MSQNLETSIKIKAGVDGLPNIHQLNQNIQETERAVNELNQETQQQNQNNSRLNTSLNQLNQGFIGLKTGVTALVASMATLGVSAGSIINTADQYMSLTARIKVATQETGNFAQAMSGIHQVAISTNSNLENTANLFSRLNTVAQDMGMTTQQTLDLTKTITQAIQIGGGSAEASEAAIQQFIQAMQGGVLRGEEFNSIMENGYPLAETLAKGLGRTTGELRKMAENGELTSERVIKAISSQAKQVQATYDQMPTTVGDALQRIATQWKILIGEFDQANGGSSAVAQFLVKFADGLGELKTLLEDVAGGFSWVNNKLQSINPETLHSLKSAVTESYQTVKTFISSLADVGDTVIDAFNSALHAILPLNGAIDNGTDSVTGFQKVLNGLRLIIATLSDGVSGINIAFKLFTGGVQAMTATVVQFRATMVGIFNEDMGKVIQQSADQLFASAKKNFDGAKQLATSFQSQTKYVWEDIHKTQEQRDKERLLQYEQTLKQIEAKEKQHHDSYKAISDERIRLEQQLHNAKLAKNQEEIDKATASLDKLKQKEQEYRKQQKAFADERLQIMQEWTDAQIRLATENGSALTTIEKKTIQAKVQAQGLTVEFDNAGKAIVKTAEAVTQISNNTKKITDDARKGATALGLDLDVSLNRVSEAFQANVKHLDNLYKGLDGLGAKGSQVGETLYQGWSKMLSGAKTQAEIDLANQKFEEFRKQGVFSTKQVERGLIAIRQANNKLSSELSETEQAFERLGIKTKEQLKLAADLAVSDFEKVRTSGQATAEQLEQAYDQVLKAAQASGDAQAIANAKAQGVIAGIKQQAEKTSDSIQQSMNNASQSVNNLSQTAYSASSGFDALGQSADEATAKAEQAIEKATEAAEKGGKLGTTTNSYYNLEAIANELKNKGYDDTQALAKAREVFQKASQQMMNWAGTDSTLRNLAKNRIERHGVTAEAMYQAMKQASEQALELKAQKARQEQQLQQLQQTLQQLQSTPTNTVNVGDFSTALNDVIAKAQAQGGQQVMQQLLQEMKRKPR